MIIRGDILSESDCTLIELLRFSCSVVSMTKIKITLLPRDKDGIPVVEGAQIEQVAYQVLDHIDPEALREPQKLSVDKMKEWFTDKKGISFEEKDIPDVNGKQVLGYLDPDARKVALNQGAHDYEARWLFTFAHELGHVVFHQDVDLARLSIDWFDTEEQVHEENLMTGFTCPKDWLEWQANRFASCLLMPKEPFIKQLWSVQDDIGYSRAKRGWIYLEDSRSNQKEYMRIIGRLENTFGVSYTALECRLRQLNLLEDHRGDSLGAMRGFLRLGPLS